MVTARDCGKAAPFACSTSFRRVDDPRANGCVIWPPQVAGMGPGNVFGNHNPRLVGGADKASGRPDRHTGRRCPLSHQNSPKIKGFALYTPG